MLEISDDVRYQPLFEYQAAVNAPLPPLATDDALTLQQIAEFGLILPPRHLAT